jgi:hypothetical protein
LPATLRAVLPAAQVPLAMVRSPATTGFPVTVWVATPVLGVVPAASAAISAADSARL